MAFYTFSGIASLMNGSVWMLGMKGAQDDGCLRRATAVAYLVHFSSILYVFRYRESNEWLCLGAWDEGCSG